MEKMILQIYSILIYIDIPIKHTSSLPSLFQIGQYLLTVPQQLEPYVLEDNPMLGTALKYGKLPYTAEQSQ